jgi:hypothetical protein
MAEALGELAMKENLNVTDPAALLPLAEAWKEAWSSSLESSFPARQYGRAELTIYLLAETYLPALIEKTQGPEMQPPSRHALLAVWI